MLNKIKAFTIIEVAISMLISAIVIGIVYYAFSLFTMRFIVFREQANIKSDFYLFEKAFTFDLERAEWIDSSENEIILMKSDSLNDAIEYQVLNYCIVRKEQFAVDTFRILIDGFSINKYTKKEIFSKIIEFHMKIKSEEIQIGFKKLFSALQFIKYEAKKDE